MQLDKLEDIEIEGIDYKDYPDFSDAFLAGATLNGEPLDELELEFIQDTYPDWFYEQVTKSLI